MSFTLYWETAKDWGRWFTFVWLRGPNLTWKHSADDYMLAAVAGENSRERSSCKARKCRKGIHVLFVTIFIEEDNTDAKRRLGEQCGYEAVWFPRAFEITPRGPRSWDRTANIGKMKTKRWPPVLLFGQGPVTLLLLLLLVLLILLPTWLYCYSFYHHHHYC